MNAKKNILNVGVLHETCLVHAFHLVAEFIRVSHPKAYQLISFYQKTFFARFSRLKMKE